MKVGSDILVTAAADGTLVPYFDSGREWVKTLQGEFVVRLVKQRNLAHHRKFFSLVNLVAQNHPVWNDKARALAAIKVAAGHCDFLPTGDGDGVAIPRSISFDRMDQDSFDEFYQNAVDAVVERLFPGVERSELLEQLASY